MADRSQPPALRRMLESGASLSGTTTGALIGATAAGPGGAIVGAAGGWAIEEVMKVGIEFALRHLAPRAEMRVGAVVLLASDEISARIVAGEVPREDLREEITPDRFRADELAEATLRAAADTHEERKLPYMAHLLAAIAFEPDLSHAHANQLIGLADSLTYRQLVALAAFTEITGPWVDRGVRGEAPGYQAESGELVSLRADLLDLFRRGLVTVSKREESVRKKKPYQPSGQRRGRFSLIPEYEYVKETLPWPAVPMEISPRATRLSTEGERLVRMMRLDEISADDRQHLVWEHIRIPEHDAWKEFTDAGLDSPKG